MRRVVPVLVVTAIAIASCSSRPVVFSAPWFDADEARKSNPAVLLPEDIDIQAMVPDFITAYDGDPGRGVREARSVLLDCLTGERISQLSSRGVRLDFVDATSTLHEASLRALIGFESDKYGIRSLVVKDPGALAALLLEGGIEYLICFPELVFAHQVLPTRGTGRGGISARGGKHVYLSGEAIVWSMERQDIAWHGIVSGHRRIHGGASKGTIEGAIEAFAGDLYNALN